MGGLNLDLAADSKIAMLIPLVLGTLSICNSTLNGAALVLFLFEPSYDGIIVPKNTTITLSYCRVAFYGLELLLWCGVAVHWYKDKKRGRAHNSPTSSESSDRAGAGRSSSTDVGLEEQPQRSTSPSQGRERALPETAGPKPERGPDGDIRSGSP